MPSALCCKLGEINVAHRVVQVVKSGQLKVKKHRWENRIWVWWGWIFLRLCEGTNVKT